MNEQNILAAAIADKQAFEQIQAHLGFSEFSALGQHWFKQIGDYYSRDDGSERADVATLRSLGLGAADARHHETLGGYFDDLPLVRVSAPNVVAEILDSENVNHARSAGADEVIESHKIGYAMIAHAVGYHGTATAMSRLLLAGAHSVYIGKIPGKRTEAMAFGELMAELVRRNDLV